MCLDRTVPDLLDEHVRSAISPLLEEPLPAFVRLEVLTALATVDEESPSGTALKGGGRVEDESDAVRPGRLFILPSTYIGGYRYTRHEMHDIIAIFNQIGHPDIFLTMTCNPSCSELTRDLLPKQTPQDRPDPCARVFRLKMKDLMSMVIYEEVFGTVVAHVRVIQFQKRCLFHAHVVFFLDEIFMNDLRTPEIIDRIISAEIPSA